MADDLYDDDTSQQTKKTQHSHHQRSSCSFDFYDIELDNECDDEYDHEALISRHRRSKKRNSSDKRLRSKSEHVSDQKKPKKKPKKRKKKAKVQFVVEIDEKKNMDVDVDIDLDIDNYDFTAVTEISEEKVYTNHEKKRRKRSKSDHKKKKKKRRSADDGHDGNRDKKLKKRKPKKHKKDRHHKRRHSDEGSNALEEAVRARRKKKKKKRRRHSHHSDALQSISECETDDEQRHKRRHSHDGSNTLQERAQSERRHSHDGSNTLQERAQTERKHNDTAKTGKHNNKYLHRGYRSRPEITPPTTPLSPISPISPLSPLSPVSPKSVRFADHLQLTKTKSLRTPIKSDKSDKSDKYSDDEDDVYMRMKLKKTQSLPYKPSTTESLNPSGNVSLMIEEHVLDVLETERRASDECYVIGKCVAMKRIKILLEFYQKILNDVDHQEDLLNVYCCKYKHLLNDLHHILMAHLNGGKKHNDTKFGLIYELIDVECDIRTCHSFVRNNQSKDSYSVRNDRRLNFYIGVLDTIHCLFIHSYDTGSRFKVYEDEIKDETGGMHMNDDKVMIKAYKDNALSRMNKILYDKSKLLSSILGSNDLEIKKWNYDFQGFGNEKTMKSSSKTTLFPYNFGQKFYYWKHYKDNKDEDSLYNAGYTYSEWYVSPRYSTFKSEILSNKHYALSKKQYILCYFCAQQYMKTYYIRGCVKQERERYDAAMVQTKERIWDEFSLDYGIASYATISIEHIVSILLYTDYFDLRAHFVDTFKRCQSSNETDIDFKSRHGEFYHLAKYLRECVEVYGEWISSSSCNTFYVGIVNKIIFSEFCGNMNIALSTSTELSIVALHQYRDESRGFILELTQNCTSPHALFLKYFNVSLLSSSCNESERLFIGGCAPITFNSIICVWNNENYSCFLCAINILQSAMNGEKIKYKISDVEYVVIAQLIRYELDANVDHELYPIYATELFHFAMNNVKYIGINIHNLSISYPQLQKYFVSPTTHMPLFEYLTKLCPQCVEIEIEMMSSNNTISALFLCALAPIIYRLQKNSKLERIRFLNIANRCNDKELKTFKSSMNDGLKSGDAMWSIQIKNKSNYKEKYQYEITKHSKPQSSLMHKMKNVFGKRSIQSANK